MVPEGAGRLKASGARRWGVPEGAWCPKAQGARRRAVPEGASVRRQVAHASAVHDACFRAKAKEHKQKVSVRDVAPLT